MIVKKKMLCIWVILMNKKEYINLLKEVKINILNELNDSKVLINKNILPDKEYIDKTENLLYILSILNGLLSIAFIGRNNYISTFLLIYSLILYLKSNKIDKDYKGLVNDYELILFFMNQEQDQIDQIDNGIKFIESCSEEELNLFLSYKMN